MNASGYLLTTGPANTTRPSASTDANSVTASMRFARSQVMIGVVYHRITSGAMVIAPAASPSHHVIHTCPKLSHCAKPPIDNDSTPIVALIVVLMRPASTL